MVVREVEGLAVKVVEGLVARVVTRVVARMVALLEGKSTRFTQQLQLGRKRDRKVGLGENVRMDKGDCLKITNRKMLLFL